MNNNPAPIAAVPMSNANTEAPPVLGSSPSLGIVERITPSLADDVLSPAVVVARVVVLAPPEISLVLGAPEVFAPLLLGSAPGVSAVGPVPVVVLMPVFSAIVPVVVPAVGLTVLVLVVVWFVPMVVLDPVFCVVAVVVPA